MPPPGAEDCLSPVTRALAAQGAMGGARRDKKRLLQIMIPEQAPVKGEVLLPPPVAFSLL